MMFVHSILSTGMCMCAVCVGACLTMCVCGYVRVCVCVCMWVHVCMVVCGGEGGWRVCVCVYTHRTVSGRNC